MGIYLDNHSCSQPFPTSLERMHILWKEKWGSVLAPHQIGQDALVTINTSLALIYEALGAGEEDVFTFTTSGAEAISQVVLSTYTDFIKENGKNHFLASCLEGSALFHSLQRVEKLGCMTKKLPVNSSGQLTKETLEEAIRPKTSLVSFSWAHPITGVVQPLHDIAEVCRQKEVKLHVDASAALGKLFFRFQDLDVDYLTFEGDMLHAPKGTGGLLQKGSSFLSPLISGPVDYPAPLVAALASSLTQLQEHFDHVSMETTRLRDLLEQGIQEGLSDVHVFFSEVERLPSTSVIAFAGVANEALLYALNRRGVYASLGGGRFQRVQEILRSCKVNPSLAASALCFSLSYETTQKNIEDAVSVIVETVRNLRKTSRAFSEVDHV